MAVLDAGLVVEVDDFSQPTEAHCGREWRDNEIAAEPGGKLDGKLREGGDVDRDRTLDRLGCNAHVVEAVMLAVMGNSLVRRP